MIGKLQNLLRRTIENEIREPFITFPVPGLGTLGIASPHPIFWAQIIVVLTIQTAVNAITAVAIYYLVIKHRGSIQSYLIGYGLICPGLLLFPFQLAQFLRVHNKALMLGQAGSMAVVLFRCLMAIHATLPPFVERNVQSLVLYFASPVQFQYDPHTGQVMRSSKEEFRKTLLNTMAANLKLTLLLNLLSYHDYELFPRRNVEHIWDLFYWRNLLNNLAMAHLAGAGLAGGSMAVGTIVEFLTGCRAIVLFDSPLTESSSPSDFWGRRWNALVHIVLKGGVYVPLRKNGFPVAMAALGTFAASGLLHEYILTAFGMVVAMQDDQPAYTPRYGIHLAFFVWNGILLVLEGLLHHHPVFQQAKRKLPAPMITAMVIMTVLPVGHWFTEEYVEIGFFDDLALGMPKFIWKPFRWEVKRMNPS